MTERTPIPDELATRVMFASDRMCCVCRHPNRSVQIHHIDEDPSNNDWGNLAVLCLDCHSAAGTKPAFARNLTPELVRQYNASWRGLVRGRLLPDAPPEIREYAQEVLSELNFTFFQWSTAFYQYRVIETGGNFRDETSRWPVPYSPSEHERSAVFVDRVIPDIGKRLQEILAAHGDVVPVSVKLGVLRALRDLNGVRFHHYLVPRFPAKTEADRDMAFQEVFSSAAQAINGVTDRIEEARKAMAPPE